MPDYSLKWTTMFGVILAGQWPLPAHPAKRPCGVQGEERWKNAEIYAKKGKLFRWFCEMFVILFYSKH